MKPPDRAWFSQVTTDVCKEEANYVTPGEEAQRRARAQSTWTWRPLGCLATQATVTPLHVAWVPFAQQYYWESHWAPKLVAFMPSFSFIAILKLQKDTRTENYLNECPQPVPNTYSYENPSLPIHLGGRLVWVKTKSFLSHRCLTMASPPTILPSTGG